MILRPIARTYAPVGDHLATRAAAGEGRVTLTFARVEALIGRPLPASARAANYYRAWWHGRTGAPHAWYGWQRGGWTVEAVDRVAETVTFTRGDGVPS